VREQEPVPRAPEIVSQGDPSKCVLEEFTPSLKLILLDCINSIVIASESEVHLKAIQ